jgi:crotonobetainyl-CoA:carnitine CoA-transferase CaiB-like acyl-CoA transferase
MSEPPSFAPLHGVRIVDFSTNLAGPFGGLILAQLGADVIKIEAPAGDDSRGWGGVVGGVSAAFSYANAGKRGMVLDLKAPRGVEVVLRLLETADVMLQSMRPGVVDRLGIGEAAVRAVNPEIIYYDVNAFGSGEVGTALPGYDPLVQAFSGIMAMTGHDGAPPTRCAPSLVDLGTGMWTAMGVLAALLARRSGDGPATLETALVDTAFSFVGYQASVALATGQRPPRAGSGNPIASPYQCYETSDGYVLIAAANQRLWQGVVRALEAPSLGDDPRFSTVAERSRHRAELEVEMNAVMRKRTMAQWLERLSAEGVPAGQVQGLEQAARSPVATERETFVPAGQAPMVRLPWRVDGGVVATGRPAPTLGEHTREILLEIGYDAGEVDELAADGSVGEAVAAPV